MLSTSGYQKSDLFGCLAVRTANSQSPPRARHTNHCPLRIQKVLPQSVLAKATLWASPSHSGLSSPCPGLNPVSLVSCFAPLHLPFPTLMMGIVGATCYQESTGYQLTDKAKCTDSHPCCKHSKSAAWGCRDGSTVRSICSCRGTAPTWWLTNSITPSPTTSSDLCGH